MGEVQEAAVERKFGPQRANFPQQQADRGESRRIPAATAEAESRRRSAALIGLAGAIGAFGGVLVNLAFRQSFLAGGNGDAAYTGFLVAYAGCSALT
ncbi:MULTISPECIES: hypothetical protein [unclassified Kitasatospora]|uniref:hypothetical protein n=1 Tax=unclassified Kitasatospora TaxID=2633591 RepID=UPI00340817D5